MQEKKLVIGGTCELVFTEYDGGFKDVSLEYVEHATDHWNSDSTTSISIDDKMARGIIAFLRESLGIKKENDE